MPDKDWTLESLAEQREQLILTAKGVLEEDKSAAESIVDETIEEVRNQVAYGKIPTSLRTLTLRIVVNKSMSWIRTHKQSKRPANLEPDDEYDRQMEQIKLCLDKLRADEKQLITLLDVEQKSYDEVTKILGVSPSAIRSRHSRARKKFLRFYNECCQQETS